MFSGIVEESAEVLSVDTAKYPFRLTINSKSNFEDLKIGDSLCVSGVCLTIVHRRGRKISFDMVRETVARTNLGKLNAGDSVNLERSMKLGERVHGHLLFGHVDASVRLLSRVRVGADSYRFVFSLPAKLRRFVVPKGSIGLNGISLTVGEVEADRFTVYIIPHTLAVTNFATLRVGQLVNIEIDMLARYALNEPQPGDLEARAE